MPMLELWEGCSVWPELVRAVRLSTVLSPASGEADYGAIVGVWLGVDEEFYSEHMTKADAMKLYRNVVKLLNARRDGLRPENLCACEECGGRKGNHFTDCSKKEQ